MISKQRPTASCPDGVHRLAGLPQKQHFVDRGTVVSLYRAVTVVRPDGLISTKCDYKQDT